MIIFAFLAFLILVVAWIVAPAKAGCVAQEVRER